jgi:hypothetical protein
VLLAKILGRALGDALSSILGVSLSLTKLQ